MQNLLTPELQNVKELLDDRYRKFNNPAFIPNDPICIPHQFTKKQDIEISGFFASILAWGQRKTIINKCTELMARFNNEPHNFILIHSDVYLNTLPCFTHRTF